MQIFEIITPNGDLKFDIVVLWRLNHFLSEIKITFPDHKNKWGTKCWDLYKWPFLQMALEVLPIPASQQERLTKIHFSWEISGTS